MAYDLANRFSSKHKCYRIFEPGAYQHGNRWETKTNQVPFLSSTSRKPQIGANIYTHSIYDGDIRPKIPNVTSLMSRVPRFPYEALSKEDLEEILCKCGFDDTCECPVEGEEEVVVCQGKVPKRIFVGSTGPCRGDNYLQIPCKGEKWFLDGSQNRKNNEVDTSPPFYDTRVHESTAFYQGCKWSTRTGSRSAKALEQRPGPADYTIERERTKYEICADKLRSYKRKTSKQYRFLESVQRRNILEGAPGPAEYSPTFPKSTGMKHLGPKADRFSAPELTPGPADYNLRRAFDAPDPPDKPCHVILPVPACFGVKAKRFRSKKEEGPGPASYNIKSKLYPITKCQTAPFGSSSERFKQDIIQESDDEDDCYKEEYKEPCPTHTWEFKSKTVRIKQLKKDPGPSPADVPQSKLNIKRPAKLQYVAPFFSSDGRFRPWYNWIPVHGKLVTPAPYNALKPKCLPAVSRGPLVRSQRFPPPTFLTPAPNEYRISGGVSGGVETVLSTYNKRLQDNMTYQHTFVWEVPLEERKLSYEEKKNLLLKKCIDICDDEQKGSDKNEPKPDQEEMNNNIKEKPKLLRYFLHTHAVKQCN